MFETSRQGGASLRIPPSRPRRHRTAAGVARMLAAFCLVTLAGWASDAYSNFGASNSSSTNPAIPVSADTNGRTVAQSFTPKQDYTLGSISLALSVPSGSSGASFTVALMTDVGGGSPGSVIEQFTVTAVPTSQANVTPVVVTSASQPTLLAYTQYWVAVSPVGGSAGVWQTNTISDVAGSAPNILNVVSSTGLAGPWDTSYWFGQPRGAFAVSGTPLNGQSNPVITSLVPASIAAGGPDFTLTVNGSNFVTGDSVQWNGLALSSTFVSDTQLTATVPSNLIASATNASITVSNPVSGSTSGPSGFTVTSQQQVTIASLNPASAVAGGPTFTLTVTGTNFASGATVNFGATALTPSSISATQIQVAVPSNLIASAGSANVTVSQSGAASNALTFTISGVPQFTITGLNPASAAAGSAAFTLTVTGSNFTSDATVHFGTATLTPTSVSATQIQAPVPTNLLATPGAVSVTVVQTSGTSNALTFTVTAANLQVSSLSPSSAIAGGADLPILISGSGFSAGAVVMFGAAQLTPGLVLPDKIVVTIPASLLTTIGTPAVSVKQSYGTSNALMFVIGLPAGQPLAIASGINLLPGQVGAAYNGALVATGGTPPYTWSLTGAPLPAGLTLAANGAITGTPTVAGTTSVAAKVIDSASASLSGNFVLYIAPVTSPATIITDSVLPSGVVGVPYNFQLTATGGTPPFTWSILQNMLPAGLSLTADGVITGTPTTAGTSAFTLQATDSIQAQVSKTFSLEVDATAASSSGAISHFASGGGWDSTIYLVNTATTASDIEVKFLGDDGTPLTLTMNVSVGGASQTVTTSDVRTTVAPGATMTIVINSPGTTVGTSGWLRVTSPGSVKGYAAYHYTAVAGAQSAATVPLETAFGTTFLLPYDGTDGLQTGVALANLSSHAATLTITALDENGATIGTSSVALPASGHTSFMLSDKLPAITSNRGVIRFSSSGAANISGLALRVYPTGGFASVPKF